MLTSRPRGRGRGRGRRSRCRRPSRRRRRSRRSSAPGSRPGSPGARPPGSAILGEARLRAPPPARAAPRCRPRSPWSASRSSVTRSSPRPPARAVRSEVAGLPRVAVEGQAHAEAELGVVLEEGVGPGRPAPVAVGRVGRRGQVAAVDRGAARGVGDQRPVAEELGEQLDVGRLAAAGAGARVLEERLEELRALQVQLHRPAVGLRDGRGRRRSSPAPARGCGGCGAMSMALCFGFDLSLAGQTITQRVQPVQSSGATWIVYFRPFISGT